MSGRKNHPKIQIRLTIHDWVMEITGVALLIIIIALPLIFIKELPEIIPTHFDASGQPDGFGGKSSFWILPLSGIIIYVLLTILEAFPHIYNFPVKITQENAEIQYRLATRMLRILKIQILIMYSFILYMTIKTVKGETSGLVIFSFLYF